MGKGFFIVNAGANASGKTSVIKPKHIDGRVTHYLDPDRPELLLLDSLRGINPEILVLGDVKKILTESTLATFKEALPKSANKLTKGRFTSECVADWLNSADFRNEGIAIESTLSGSSHDRDSFKLAKNHGMQVELYFVFVPLDKSLSQERKRVIDGEQDEIPETDIRRRHTRGIKNLPKHIESGNIDVVMIYDNSREKGKDVPILRIEDGRATSYPEPHDWPQGMEWPPSWFKDAGLEKYITDKIRIEVHAQREDMTAEATAYQDAVKFFKEAGIDNPVVLGSEGLNGTYRGKILGFSQAGDVKSAVMQIDENNGIIIEIKDKETDNKLTALYGEEIKITLRDGALESVAVADTSPVTQAKEEDLQRGREDIRSKGTGR